MTTKNLFSYGEGGGANNILIAQNGAAGDGSIVIGRYADNVIFSNGILTVDEWSQIGLTYDGSTMRLYINGAADNTWNGTLDSYTTYAWLGGIFTGENPYSGGLDEYAYWNGTALTGTQMSNLANAAIPEPSSASFLIASGLAPLLFRRRKPRSAARH